MPLRDARARAIGRFRDVLLLLNHIGPLEPTNPLDPMPHEVKILKGLFFVHLYAAVEGAIVDVVQEALIAIAAKGVQTRHFEPPLLSILLQGKITALKNTKGKQFIKSAELFSDAASNNVLPIDEVACSGQLQNIWAKTIDEIATILGMPGLRFDVQTSAVLDELVGRRNAVAHGRDSAARVGERFRAPDLRLKLNKISAAINQVIDALERHLVDRRYIKPRMRRYYP